MIKHYESNKTNNIVYSSAELFFSYFSIIRILDPKFGSGSKIRNRIQDPKSDPGSEIRIRIQYPKSDPISEIGSNIRNRIQYPKSDPRSEIRIRIRDPKSDPISEIRIRILILLDPDLMISGFRIRIRIFLTALVYTVHIR